MEMIALCCKIAFFGLTVLFSGCSDPLTGAEQAGTGFFEFSLPEITTRATDTQFENGDLVGIYVVACNEGETPVLSADNYADNRVYQYGNGKLLPVDENQQIPFRAGKKYAVYAYYPYDSGMAHPARYLHTIRTDQRSGADYRANDLMTASVGDTEGNPQVVLRFKRVYSLIEISHVKSMGETPESSSLYSSDYSSTVNLQTGAVTGNTTDRRRIFLNLVSDNDRSCLYRAIIPPQAIRPSGSGDFGFSYGADSYSYGFDREQTFVAGEKHRFTTGAVLRTVTCTLVTKHGEGCRVLTPVQAVSEGELCTVQAEKDELFLFDGWYEDDRLQSTELTWSFVVGRENRMLEARFTRQFKVEIDVNLDTNVLKPYLAAICGAGVYDCNTCVNTSVELIPGSGWGLYAVYDRDNPSLYNYDYTQWVGTVRDYRLHYRFERVWFDGVYESPELSFRSDADFTYPIAIPDLQVTLQPGESAHIHVESEFEGDQHCGARYSQYTYKIACFRDGTEWGSAFGNDGGRLILANTSGSTGTYTVKFDKKMLNMKHGSYLRQGRILSRVKVFKTMDSNSFWNYQP